MTDTGFVEAKSDNLPKVDPFMMTAYFASNSDFTSTEMKGVKALRSERESYGDNAIGYVQVKRDGDGICVVKARITPEHNVRHKTYSVTAVCDEAKEIIISVQCEDCAAHLGGCKHAIAFLAWLHRRSEDPPSTSVKCYWKKSKLSSVGTALKFIKAKDMGQLPETEPLTDNGNLLAEVINYSLEVGHMDSQLTKYYKEFSPVEKLSINYLINTMPNVKSVSPLEFLNYCRTAMNTLTCEKACRETMDQCNCPLWHELRYARITASKAYDAVHCKLYDGTVVESIMGATKLKDSEAMKRGRMLEKEVVKEVEKRMGIKINSCGLRLSENYPVIGASPDGESKDYSVEIKCPSSEKAMKRYITQENKITAKYMAQVQLQMYFSQKKKALFCVANNDFESSKNVNILTINYNEEYCKDVLDKCTLFWNKAIFPILIKKY